jgi:hypothetical protein
VQSPPKSPSSLSNSSVNSSSSGQVNSNLNLNQASKFKRGHSLARYMDTPLSTTVRQKISRLVPNMLNMFAGHHSNHSPGSRAAAIDGDKPAQNESSHQQANTNTPKTTVNTSNGVNGSFSTSPSPVSITSSASSNSSASCPVSKNQQPKARSSVDPTNNTIISKMNPLTVTLNSSVNFTPTSAPRTVAASKTTTNNLNNQTPARHNSDFLSTQNINSTSAALNNRNVVYNDYHRSKQPGGNMKPAFSSFNDQTELMHGLSHSRGADDPGSVCEFLSSKLTTNDALNNSDESGKTKQQTTANNCNNFVLSDTSSGIRVNQVKLSSSQQTDLRQVNPPRKAELYDAVSKTSALNMMTGGASETAAARHHHINHRVLRAATEPTTADPVSPLDNTNSSNTESEENTRPQAPMRTKVKRQHGIYKAHGDYHQQQQQHQQGGLNDNEEDSQQMKLINMNLSDFKQSGGSGGGRQQMNFMDSASSKSGKYLLRSVGEASGALTERNNSPNSFNQFSGQRNGVYIDSALGHPQYNMRKLKSNLHHLNVSYLVFVEVLSELYIIPFYLGLFYRTVFILRR